MFQIYDPKKAKDLPLHIAGLIFSFADEIEIGFGAGRSWVVGDGEGFTSLKLGLNVSNPWAKRFLVGFNIYYRRDQGLRDSFHDDRVGAVLRFGF